MKTLLLLLLWLVAFLLVGALCARLAFAICPQEPMTDDESEAWRRAFEGTEYEWPKERR